MPESANNGQLSAGFEPVYVELGWWDGPRAGVAAVNGSAHYFWTVGYEDCDGAQDQFFVWPAHEMAVALEQEQWAIFIEWNVQFEAGAATVDTHPAIPGTHTRYDELQSLLAPHRAVPDHPLRLVACWQFGDHDARYLPTGPNYRMRWHERTS